MSLAGKRRTFYVDEPRQVPLFALAAGGCWIWTGQTMYGYGYWGAEPFKNSRAHRVMYQEFNGPIPAGYHIDHLCKVKACVNPAHLEAVTPAENNRRSLSPSALNMFKTHCPRGHALSAPIHYPSGTRRDCRECNNARRRVSHAR